MAVISSTIAGNDSICSTLYQYNASDVCKEQLLNVLKFSNCLEEEENVTLFVLTNATEWVNVLKKYLQQNTSSYYCKKELLSLACLVSFRLSNSSSILIQTNYSHCWKLKSSLCRTSWEEATRLGLQLPDCDSLPLQSPQCYRNMTVHRDNESSPFGNIAHRFCIV